MNNGLLTPTPTPPAMPYGLLGRPSPVQMPASPASFDPQNIPGLVAYWPFNEDASLTNAQALDVSGNNFHLTSSGALSAPGRAGRGRLLATTGAQWNATGGILSRSAYNNVPLWNASEVGWSMAFWLFTDLTYNSEGTSSTAAGINFNSIQSPSATIPRFSGGQPANGFATISARCYFTDGSFVVYQSGINIAGGLTSITPERQWTHVAFVADPTTCTFTMYVNGVSRPPVRYASDKRLSSFSSGLPCTMQWPGAIDECVVYNRAITEPEVQRLASVSFSPTSATTLHPECQSWISRVLTNGGTVSTTTVSAVSNFCYAIDAAGIRDRFHRLNLFCGDQLQACLVPLYRGTSLAGTQLGNATDTNVNFVAGDYSESQGLTATSAGKQLRTGLLSSSMPSNAGHAAWSIRNSSFLNIGFIHGFSHTAGYRTYCFLSNANSHNIGCASGSSSEIGVFNPTIYARTVASRTSLTSFAVYRDGVLYTTNTATVTATSGSTDQFSLFGANGSSSGRAGLHYYSVGNGMTAAQASAFDAIASTFLTALGRS